MKDYRSSRAEFNRDKPKRSHSRSRSINKKSRRSRSRSRDHRKHRSRSGSRSRRDDYKNKKDRKDEKVIEKTIEEASNIKQISYFNRKTSY